VDWKKSVFICSLILLLAAGASTVIFLTGPTAKRSSAIKRSAKLVEVTGLELGTFRLIILTTLTTFGGLTPIILETSRQAVYLVPMAISLGFGIVFATEIILVLVPCLYMILEDLHIAVRDNTQGLTSDT